MAQSIPNYFIFRWVPTKLPFEHSQFKSEQESHRPFSHRSQKQPTEISIANELSKLTSAGLVSEQTDRNP